ncbi:MAG: pyrD, partial [Thermomicrobiales bacterium]|nr:pyrD [Thermomicrobiales bacterium]
MTPNLWVDLAPTNPHELRLRNPVIAASGCFGYGEEYASVIDIDRLGAFVSKGITPGRRSGNPMPRIVESPAGMLNAIGLQNPGIQGFVKKYPA